MYLPMRSSRSRAIAAATVAAAVLALSGCGSNSSAAGVTLSAEGELGRQVARTKGCAGCHGSNGEGQVGPAFVGLYGTTVTFDDGSTAIADDAYLRESMLDPSARRVEGFKLPMPETNLSDDDIDQLIAYIRDLAEPTDGSDADASEVAP